MTADALTECVCVCRWENNALRPTPQTAADGLFVLEEGSVSLSEGIRFRAAEWAHSAEPEGAEHLTS